MHNEDPPFVVFFLEHFAVPGSQVKSPWTLLTYNTPRMYVTKYTLYGRIIDKDIRLRIRDTGLTFACMGPECLCTAKKPCVGLFVLSAQRELV